MRIGSPTPLACGGGGNGNNHHPFACYTNVDVALLVEHATRYISGWKGSVPCNMHAEHCVTVTTVASSMVTLIRDCLLDQPTVSDVASGCVSHGSSSLHLLLVLVVHFHHHKICKVPAAEVFKPPLPFCKRSLVFSNDGILVSARRAKNKIGSCAHILPFRVQIASRRGLWIRCRLSPHPHLP